MKKIITFDVGGTFVKWALINQDNHILDKGKYPTEAFEIGTLEVIKKLASKANELSEKFDDVIGVGISIAGVVNSDTGVFFSPTKNLPGSKDLNVIKVFSEICDLQVVVINDANAATMGEKAIGGLQSVNNALFIVIGTGIGGGIVVNGDIYQGHNYSAGEVGRQLVKGKKWELSSSTKALVEKVKLALEREELTGEEISEMVIAKNNNVVNEIYQEWMENLGIGIVNSIYNSNPEVLVLGGGYVENDSFNIDELKKIVLELSDNDPVIEKTKFIKASAGNDSALHGLAYLVLKRNQLI